MPHFPSWRFREMERGEINVDPVHDEFFKAQELADALVREAIQNSLDARRGRSTVRVHFRLASGVDALPADAAVRYVDGLLPHLDASGYWWPAADESMPFLVVEDFGTRGLTGDPSIDPEIESGTAEKNDFYYFWRNVGRTGKREQDRGRWGLGKAVFSVASNTRTMFGLTQRSDEDRRLLLGQSVLKTHLLDGHRFSPYGFFGRAERDGFVLPVESETLVERFAADFQLHRNEAGLSIVVPWYRQDVLTFDSIAASVLRQYFYPITRGDLVVTVEEGGRSTTLNARSIDSAATQFTGDSAESLRRLCDLTRWSLTLSEDDLVSLRDHGPSAPKWTEDALPEKLLAWTRERFERGERIALRVPLAVKRKKSRPAASYFDVFLEKDESLRRGEHHFIRRGITIPEVKTLREKPVRALLFVDDEPLATLLGDAENPAHSDWLERADKVREQYDHGAFTVRYVRSAIGHIAAMLARPPEGRVRDLLTDVFSVELPREGGADKGVVPARGLAAARTLGPRMPVTSSKPRISIAATSGGFTLRGSGNAGDVGVPHAFEVAYRVRTGNPFRKYNPLDFELGAPPVEWSVRGADIRAAGRNRVDFVPTSPDFYISVTGFDNRRDLVVRIDRRDEE